MIPTAVCVMMPSKDGEKFLAVSRRNSDSLWGMPGGKVDPGETTHSAIIREVKEETGYCLREDLLIPIYSSICRGEKDFWVTTYLSLEKHPIRYLALEDDILWDMKPRFVFLYSDSSPFADYNKHAFAAYDEYMRNL